MCAGARVHGYLPPHIFQHQTGRDTHVYDVLEFHGPGACVQNVPLLFPWNVHAMRSHNFREWWKASANITLAAPFVTGVSDGDTPNTSFHVFFLMQRSSGHKPTLTGRGSLMLETSNCWTSCTCSSCP